MLLAFDDVYRTATKPVELPSCTQSGFVGMEAIVLISRLQINKALILAVDGDVTAVGKPPQHVALSLSAIHWLSWINLRRPEMHRSR